MKTQPLRTRSGSRPGSRGFTLVELLVGIAIIATLALLVSMMARNSQRKANEAAAISALRQVAMANMEFGVDNQSKIATPRWEADPMRKEQGRYVSSSSWGRLSPYLFPDLATNNQAKLKREMKKRLNVLFNTPNSSKMTGTVPDGSKIYHDGSGLPVLFAFNTQLYEYNDWQRVSKLADASQIMWATCGFGIFNEGDGQTADPRTKDGSKPINNICYLDSGKAMVSFLDGHVELISAPIPTRRFKVD